MIRITIELESARTLQVTKIGQMHIWNLGDSTNKEYGNYSVAVCRKGNFDVPRGHPPSTKQTLRSGKVWDYPRLSYNVWRLVIRALKDCFTEEK